MTQEVADAFLGPLVEMFNRSSTGGVRGRMTDNLLDVASEGRGALTVTSDGSAFVSSGTDLHWVIGELAREIKRLRSGPGRLVAEPVILDTYEDNCGIEWIVRSDATWRTSTGKDDNADFKPHWNEPTVWSRWLVDKHTRAKKAQERN